MNIVLINAPWYDERHPELWGVRAGSRWPHFQKRSDEGALPRYVPFPFFMAIAAGTLDTAGHEVMLIDGVAENIDLQVLYGKVTAFGPDIIFLETSTPSLAYDLTVLRELKKRNDNAILVCGGAHSASMVQDLIQKEKMPDYWLAGEYDKSLPALIETLDRKGDVSNIHGLIGHDINKGNIEESADLDSLSPPLYEQLPVHNYSDPVCGLPAPVAHGWLSRGCPFGCTFCVWPQVVYANRKYRTRAISIALDEINLLMDRYGCESFYFDDDTTNIGEERMLDLAGAIKVRGLNEYPWSMMARADCMTEKMIKALAGAGLYSIKYGVESISRELINACNKSTDIDRMKKAIEWTRQAGVKMHLTFTFGVPGETLETIRETLAFAIESDPETAQFSLCTPFPGTVFYDECQKNGWLVTEDWSQYLGTGDAVISTPWLSAADLHKGYEDAVAQWHSHVAARLESRKESLIKEINRLGKTGKRWFLIGDIDFADFLDSIDEVAKRYRNPDMPFPSGSNDLHECNIPVIVSRHNEEKIWRNLKRFNPSLADKALRLYG